MTIVTTNTGSLKNKLILENLIDFFNNLQEDFEKGKDILIPKPTKETMFLGWREPKGKRQKALFYRIGSKNSKNVKLSTFKKALKQLSEFGFLSRSWFDHNIEDAKNNPCNYTTIGGVLELYELVERLENNSYQLKQPYLSGVLKKNLRNAMTEVSNPNKLISLNDFLDEH